MAYYINQEEYVRRRPQPPAFIFHEDAEEEEPVGVNGPEVSVEAYDPVEVLDQGFADGRFASTVDEDLHCAICLNVLNLPLQCQKNEHHFCTTCITRHLQDSSECPCCKEELSVETLKKPARYLTKHLSKLKIRCDYENRGCLEVVELEVLANHVTVCGFAPVRCSNEGCGQEINKQDRVSHETEICEFRRAKCHDCAQLKEEISKLNGEIGDLKGELKDQIGNLDKEIDCLKGGLKEEIDGLKNDIGELKREMGDLKIFLEEFKKQMSKMVDEVKGFVRPKESNKCFAQEKARPVVKRCYWGEKMTTPKSDRCKEKVVGMKENAFKATEIPRASYAWDLETEQADVLRPGSWQ